MFPHHNCKPQNLHQTPQLTQRTPTSPDRSMRDKVREELSETEKVGRQIPLSMPWEPVAGSTLNTVNPETGYRTGHEWRHKPEENGPDRVRTPNSVL
ncbi:hypothetical protein CDL15_Pgr010071 [Punica granatum]|uniref:Uncharacterized protein n=1 Tax=Punica granatum TaxID=22663 RepID=A0A218X598_PUNGR|nr:hypothetical protein CDL15_Pgr010071 [Punica granatum]